MNIAHHPDFDQQNTRTKPELDLEQEAKLEDQSRNALYESMDILTYKGIRGDAMLLELVKVNLQLPRPVPLTEIPMIAEIEYPEDGFLEEYTRIANLLEEAARPPEPTPLPARIDIDKIIASADLQVLYTHVDELVKIRARSPIEWSLKKEQIKKAFGKTINLNDLERIVAGEQRKQERSVAEEEPDVADIARDWAYTQREEWAYDMRAKTWRHWNGLFWEELEPKCPELNNQAVDALHAAGKDINTQSGMDTFLRCAADARAMIFPESQGCLVNFANGTLNTTTMLLQKQRREDYLTYCLPYNYVAGQHQRISNFLEQAMPDPYARNAYMAHLGLALMRDTKLRNVIILLGPPGCGKSTLLALGNLVCGAQSHEAFYFADHHLFSRELEGKRSRYAWRDRRLVGVDEVPTEALREEEIFKQMSAHSGVGMRGMNKDDHKDNRWRPKLLLAANDRPRYADVTGAVRDRAVFIECPNRRPLGQRDLDLIDGLGEELGAFAASCIFLALAVLERGYYPMSNQMKAILDSIDREGSYLKSFLAQQMIVDPDGSTITDFAYQMYRSFCQDNHVRDQYQLTKEVFSRHITSMGIGVVAKKVPSPEGEYVRGLVGIRMRQKQDGWETEDEALRKYQFDEPLIDGELTVVDGKLTVLKIAVSEIEQPVEPSEQEPLTVVTDKPENEISIETPLLDAQQPEATTSGSSIELVIVPDLPSVLSDEQLEQPLELAQVNDGYIQQASVHTCDVKGCEQEVVVYDEEYAETHGHWCPDHQNRLALMVAGDALGYPRLQHCISSAIVGGMEHWKRFATFPGAPVDHCLQFAEELLSAQDSETA